MAGAIQPFIKLPNLHNLALDGTRGKVCLDEAGKRLYNAGIDGRRVKMANASRLKANAAYRANSYDRIELQVPKGAGPELKRLSQASGARSLGAFLAGIIERETGVKCTLDGEFPARK